MPPVACWEIEIFTAVVMMQTPDCIDTIQQLRGGPDIKRTEKNKPQVAAADIHTHHAIVYVQLEHEKMVGYLYWKTAGMLLKSGRRPPDSRFLRSSGEREREENGDGEGAQV